MGAGGSRPAVDYDEAVSRLGRGEVIKIEEGFARLAVSGHLTRSDFHTGFLNSVAGASVVPEAFAEALFNGFDTDASGRVTVKEFVCSLAVLRHGSPEEKLRLLFAVYDADRDNRLTDKDLARFAHALADGRGHTCERAVDDALRTLGAAGPSIGFERFADWAKAHIDSPLVDWVFDFEEKLGVELSISDGHMASSEELVMRPLQRSESTVQRDDQTELNWLAENAGLEEGPTAALRAAWRAVAAASKLGVVDAPTFMAVVPSLPRRLAERFFRALDRSRRGTIGVFEWVVGFGTCLVGRAQDRRQLCLSLFAEEPQVEDGTALREFRAFSEMSTSVFTEESAAARVRPLGGPVGERMLTAGMMAHQPWASRADDLIRGIGHALRIDLQLQPGEPREEREIVDRMNSKFDPERPGRVGAIWYLVSARWWEQWCYFTGPHGSSGNSAHAPASMDNSELLDHGGLRIGLAHRVHYELVAEGAWKALQAWYGGGPPLARQVVELGGRRELEMYPLRLHVSRTDEKGNVLLQEKVLEISRARSLGDAKKAACKLHDMTENNVVILHRSSPNIDWFEGDEQRTLDSLNFIDGHSVLLKMQGAMNLQAGGSRPSDDKAAKDTVGLQNLGNTCYMNASLQCLLHTPLLSEYFRTDYLCDLNIEGTWGMAGKLAVAFADLVAEVEKTRKQGVGTVAPRNFRRVIGDFQPQFAGWKQQDAQEFLSIFLAGLSEDVNRTRNKPYIELKDSDGRPDAEVAKEFWTAHCRRERSAIAALFSGQFKSVLRCRHCGHANAAFDPFSFLPLPLPEHDFRWVTCNVTGAFRASVDQHTIQVCARVPKLGTVVDLLSAAAGLVGLPAIELVAADVADGYVFKLYETYSQLSALSDDARPTLYYAPRPLLGFSAPSVKRAMGGESSTTSSTEASSRAGDCLVYFVHRRLRKVQRYFLNPYRSELFGSPAIARVPAELPSVELYRAAWQHVRHLVPEFDPSADRWPFALKKVKRDGAACSSCSWRQGCLGCLVKANKPQLLSLMPESTFSIDWDASVLEQFYKAKIAAHVHEHESVELSRIERNTLERLDQCLDRLVKEEELTAYCRECSKKAGEYTEAPHSKSLNLWGAPPLLVVQLKRFHTNQGSSYKLHNLVTFPTNLDLGNYLAVAQNSDPCFESPMARHVHSQQCSVLHGLQGWDKPLRERDPGTDEAPFDTLSRECTEYRLYGVVNHIGGMGSGHYTACVRRGERWFCCNDDRVYSMPEEDVVSANAYLLFYARRDVAETEIGLRDIFPVNVAKGAVTDPEVVKKAPWVRPNADTKGAGASGGFCGIM